MKALPLRWLVLPIFLVGPKPSTVHLAAQQDATPELRREVNHRVETVMPRVIAWRRDIHEHPELSNREFRTAELVARHLTALGMEVRTGVAHTGVVGVLRGGRPGPTVALRADMDGLPVTELVDLPFMSTVRTEYNGQEVGVMHACGHDNHVAILMGVAEVLAGMRDDLPGTVKFIFQPAEEGAPVGEEGGAGLMIREGVLENPTPDAIFGLHVWPIPVGTISYRSGPFMAASDRLSIVVKGKQTHGALPWGGVDPIVVTSQIILGLQTIASRQIAVTQVPAIITIGMIQGGNRGNIIPDSVVLEGTVRSFDEGMRADIKDRIWRTASSIAQSAGATATVDFGRDGNPVTINDPALTERMLPTLRRVVGEKLQVSPLSTPAEDFALYQQRVPGFFFFLGVTPDGVDLETVARNHSPLFFADEAALPVGVRALLGLTLDFLTGRP
ncbi:MAG: amidohydrolase [Gemmatimonadales bacterium]|nr:MAG: amidohydrolase [Gemmatimonadales bacterium]